MLKWILKITPMTEFEVINRFVDVDVYGALCAYIRSNVFYRCRWHTFRFYAYNTGILILWYDPAIPQINNRYALSLFSQLVTQYDPSIP